MRVEFSAAAVSGVVRAFRSPAVFLPTGPATKMRRAAQAEGGGGWRGGESILVEAQFETCKVGSC